MSNILDVLKVRMNGQDVCELLAEELKILVEYVENLEYEVKEAFYRGSM